MNRELRDARELLSKPGDTIAETLDHLKMTQIELAERMGKTPSKVNDMISGKEPITTSTALLLEKVLSINADFWLKREAQYREKLARIEQEEALERFSGWAKMLPVKELKKYGYVASDKTGSALVEECLKFYGVANPTAWENTYVNQSAFAHYRKSSIHQTSLASITTWLRIGEIEMKKLNLPEYSRDFFKKILQDLKRLVVNHTEDFARLLKESVERAGVAVIYTPNIPKAPVSGVARWLSGNPLIQLTDRYKTNDQFWFTFYHEAGHILLHGKKELFIEDENSTTTSPEKEEEANEFAAKMLAPDEVLEHFQNLEITEKLIRQVARKFETHPAVVLARLQHLGIVPYSFGNNLKLRISLSDEIARKN
jgi:HTH-type transcriptional regulator / antitoxin HigA